MSHMSATIAYSGFPGTLLFPDIETHELAREDSLEQDRSCWIAPEAARQPRHDPFGRHPRD